MWKVLTRRQEKRSNVVFALRRCQGQNVCGKVTYVKGDQTCQYTWVGRAPYDGQYGTQDSRQAASSTIFFPTSSSGIDCLDLTFFAIDLVNHDDLTVKGRWYSSSRLPPTIQHAHISSP